MTAAHRNTGHIDDRILRMERPVCQLIRLLNVHDFIDTLIHLKETRIDTDCITNTADDGHLFSADNMSFQSLCLHHFNDPV